MPVSRGRRGAHAPKERSPGAWLTGQINIISRPASRRGNIILIYAAPSQEAINGEKIINKREPDNEDHQRPDFYNPLCHNLHCLSGSYYLFISLLSSFSFGTFPLLISACFSLAE